MHHIYEAVFIFIYLFTVVMDKDKQCIETRKQLLLSRSNQCSTSGVTTAVVCVILSVG